MSIELHPAFSHVTVRCPCVVGLPANLRINEAGLKAEVKFALWNRRRLKAQSCDHGLPGLVARRETHFNTVIGLKLWMVLSDKLEHP